MSFLVKQNLIYVNNRGGRNITIDYLKAFAIICVVFGHNIQYGSGIFYQKSNLFFDNFIFKFIYSFHMPLFMLISGYLFYFSSQKQIATNNIITNKFISLLLPALIWANISFILKIVTGIEENSIMDLFKFYNTECITSLWFLRSVFINSVLVIIINRYFKDSLLIYITIFILQFFIPDGLNLYLYKFMYPYFIIGYLFNKHYNKNRIQYKFNSKILITIIGTIFFILLLFYNKNTYIYTTLIRITENNYQDQIWYDTYRYLIGILGSLFFILVFMRNKFNIPKINNFVLLLGRETMGIYIISTFINNNIMNHFSKHINQFSILITCFETIIVLAICLITIKFISKSKYLSLLLLGKSHIKKDALITK